MRFADLTGADNIFQMLCWWRGEEGLVEMVGIEKRTEG